MPCAFVSAGPTQWCGRQDTVIPTNMLHKPSLDFGALPLVTLSGKSASCRWCFCALGLAASGSGPARWQFARCSAPCALSGTSSGGLWWSSVSGSGTVGPLPPSAARRCGAEKPRCFHLFCFGVKCEGVRRLHDGFKVTRDVPWAGSRFAGWGLRGALSRGSWALTARIHLQPFGSWGVSARNLPLTCGKRDVFDPNGRQRLSHWPVWSQ